jgi:hypothetical protein
MLAAAVIPNARGQDESNDNSASQARAGIPAL